MTENLHKGHRERMRNRFLKEGGDGFADHELLELLLFYAVPRGDVNPLAHRILAEFGTLTMLLASDAVEIASRCHIKESTAMLLTLQMAFLKRLQQEKWKDKISIDSVSKASAYAVDLLSHYTYERFYIMCLDTQKRLIHTCFIAEGTLHHADVQMRTLVEAALKYKASSVILLHNHPGGAAKPSLSDVTLTMEVQKILMAIDIDVVDHIIVADDAYYSFLEHDYLKKVDRGENI